LLSIDGRFRFWRDVGLGDKLARSLVIASLFAIVEDVDVKPAYEEREWGIREARFETRDVGDGGEGGGTGEKREGRRER
jgi:hypothetical protein